MGEEVDFLSEGKLQGGSGLTVNILFNVVLLDLTSMSLPTFSELSSESLMKTLDKQSSSLSRGGPLSLPGSSSVKGIKFVVFSLAGQISAFR